MTADKILSVVLEEAFFGFLVSSSGGTYDPEDDRSAGDCFGPCNVIKISRLDVPHLTECVSSKGVRWQSQQFQECFLLHLGHTAVQISRCVLHVELGHVLVLALANSVASYRLRNGSESSKGWDPRHVCKRVQQGEDGTASTLPSQEDGRIRPCIGFACHVRASVGNFSHWP